jgi:hypothetical protein
MDAPELWKCYQQYLCRVDSLNLALDISRMHFDERFLTSMEPAVQRTFSDMDALESGAIANPDEKRTMGDYWLRAANRPPDCRRHRRRAIRRDHLSYPRTSVFKWPRQDGPEQRSRHADVFAHLRMKWGFGPVSDNVAFRELSNDLIVDSASVCPLPGFSGTGTPACPRLLWRYCAGQTRVSDLLNKPTHYPLFTGVLIRDLMELTCAILQLRLAAQQARSCGPVFAAP